MGINPIYGAECWPAVFAKIGRVIGKEPGGLLVAYVAHMAHMDRWVVDEWEPAHPPAL